MEIERYSIPKPSLPFVARALAALLLVGLVGLGTSAYVAFSYIGHWWQALAFALVIEVCGIIEALALVRGNRFAVPGLIISLAVSTSYNWTQAEQAAATLANPLSTVQLAALAIGPMSGVFFVALSLGHEIRAHERAVEQWAANRQHWMDNQAEREARRQERREARQERLLAVSQPDTQPAVAVTATDSGSVNGSYEAFVSVMAGRNGSGPLTAAEIQRQFGVSERTAWRWLARYKDEHPAPALEAN